MSAEQPGVSAARPEDAAVDGEQALRRAAQLAETATLAPERRVAVLVQAGDWFQAKDHSRTARQVLRERASAGSGAAAARRIRSRRPCTCSIRCRRSLCATASRAIRSRRSATSRSSSRCSPTARVDGERVITREPGKSAADETLQALQAARFRPRMVEGATLDTEGVRFRQAFK